MAARLLQSFADENPDLQKQIGCMTGLLQLFDRQHALSSRRLTQKRLSSGEFNSMDSYSDKETASKFTSFQDVKQRLSSEYDRTVQPEVSSSDKLVYPETLKSMKNHASQSGRHSLDLRDVVKGSMHRETLGPNVKTQKEFRKRPVPADIKESLRVLAKLREAPSLYSESKELEDAPRYSFEGIKSVSKMKENPRFSLDSQEILIRNNPKVTQKRPTSVVAKLMGLDTLPEISCSDELLKSQKPEPVRSLKSAPSPRWKNSDIVMNPTVKKPSDESVYNEIEKRLRDIEFKQTGKDLVALKQILEAMQVKGILDCKQGEELANSDEQADQVSVSNYESPIVIMKPTKLLKKSDVMIQVDVGKTQNGNIRKGTSRNRAYIDQKNSYKESGKSAGSVSPRLQQKNVEMEKRSRPPTPPSDQTKTRRNPNKQQMNFGSPSRQRTQKKSKISTNDDQISQISNESRASSLVGDDVSVLSDMTSLDINSSQSQSSIHTKTMSPKVEDNAWRDLHFVPPEHPSPVSVLDLSMYRDFSPSSKAELPRDPIDQNVSRWYDDSNFTMKNLNSCTAAINNRTKLMNIENLVKKLEKLNSSHDETPSDYIASLCEKPSSDQRYISEILLASGLLLRDLSCGEIMCLNDPASRPINSELFHVLEQTKYNSSPCKDGGKMHRKLLFDAVNEILAKKFATIRYSSDPWLNPGKLANKPSSSQALMKELRLEVEQLRQKKLDDDWEEEEDGLKCILREDIISRSDNWTKFDLDLSRLVLDIERSIFKDIIDDLVIGAAASLKTKQGRRRQLFVN